MWRLDSLFPVPAGSTHISIRSELVRVCEGDQCAAAVLDHLDFLNCPEHGWKKLRQKEFQVVAEGLFSVDLVTKALRRLELLGYVQVERSPGEPSSYLLRTDLVSAAILGDNLPKNRQVRPPAEKSAGSRGEASPLDSVPPAEKSAGSASAYKEERDSTYISKSLSRGGVGGARLSDLGATQFFLDLLRRRLRIKEPLTPGTLRMVEQCDKGDHQEELRLALAEALEEHAKKPRGKLGQVIFPVVTAHREKYPLVSGGINGRRSLDTKRAIADFLREGA